MPKKLEVIVAHDKYGVGLYADALTLLAQRVEEGHWYDYPEGTQQAARALVEEGIERKAWNFLDSRSDHEYELVEKQIVQGSNAEEA